MLQQLLPLAVFLNQIKGIILIIVEPMVESHDVLVFEHQVDIDFPANYANSLSYKLLLVFFLRVGFYLNHLQGVDFVQLLLSNFVNNCRGSFSDLGSNFKVLQSQKRLASK